MKPPKSRKAELGSNATGGEKPHAETAESAEFKMTELGPIPVDWEVKRLGECCTRIKNGFTYSVCNRGSYKISRIETISKGVVNYSRVGYVKDAPPADYMLSNGDILFSHINSLPYIGNVALYDGKELLYHGMNLLLLRCNESANANYLYYALSSSPMRSKARELAKIAINQASISIGDLSRSEIPLPPLAEQRRIARALSDVDELISALGKLIEKKRNIKTGAMQQLLTGKTRLPGFGAARAEFKQTELGPIPVDWEVKRLGGIGESIRGVSFRPEQSSLTLMPNATVLLRANNIQDNQIICHDVLYVMNECIAGCQQLTEGDILICAANGSRNLVGKAAVWHKAEVATFGAFMAVFRCVKSVDSCFVGYLLQSQSYRRQLDDILTGSAINNLNAKDIEGLAFAFPTLAEQKAIGAVVSDMDAEIAALEADCAKYERIKSGMMQELLTGKTRLKGE